MYLHTFLLYDYKKSVYLIFLLPNICIMIKLWLEIEGIMTGNEVKKEMENLKSIFDVVRILNGKDIERIHKINHFEPCECFKFWKKDKPCQNCISLETLRTKCSKTKIEFQNDKTYFVMSKYVEIDGKPCVMEMLKQMDNNSLVDSNGRKQILSTIESYESKLYRDALTGVFNRSYYEDKIKTLKSCMGVAMIDMDDFKLYNDTCGHSVGDMVLVTVAKEIKKCIRKTDILIRYGGDEFILLLPDIDEEFFETKLKQIQNHVNHVQFAHNNKLKLSLSIGGVMSRNIPVEEALKQADKMMYQAKIQKNAVVVQKKSEDYANVPEKEKPKDTILVVDDSSMNREILSEMLKDDFHILEASDGKECIDLIQKQGSEISLILLDIIMPGIDGYGVLDFMSQNQWTDDIPVIMISSDNSIEAIRKCYEMGVSDYISRPFDAKIVYQRVFNTMKLYAKQRRLTNLVTNQIYEKEKNSRMMVSILSQIVEFRNNESGKHVLHLQTITKLLMESLVRKSSKYSLTMEKQNLISLGSVLHDIGKIGIDEKILNKPGKLTPEEFEIVKTHTIIGASMLKKLDFYQDEPLIQIAYEICRWHHERYDGKGYPDGLKGEQIPISAQIVSIADVYDALVSNRVYKKAYSHEEAISMILHGDCGQFNPILLECLKDVSQALKYDVAMDKLEE